LGAASAAKPLVALRALVTAKRMADNPMTTFFMARLQFAFSKACEVFVGSLAGSNGIGPYNRDLTVS
jgi:hypothetical protein